MEHYNIVCVLPVSTSNTLNSYGVKHLGCALVVCIIFIFIDQSHNMKESEYSACLYSAQTCILSGLAEAFVCWSGKGLWKVMARHEISRFNYIHDHYVIDYRQFTYERADLTYLGPGIDQRVRHTLNGGSQTRNGVIH